MMRIGVIALKGAVRELIRYIERVVPKASLLRRLAILMCTYGFNEELRDFSATGKPVFGTVLRQICPLKVSTITFVRFSSMPL
ncbi:hypothetical protein A8709_23180 [Paenibacillus pectinilyticus]|uniref:Uncharacterized protein n=1 Tax=Paenibacillus pectinilyticus TaxID=512399 RepID=A0A1C0ZRU4_9BACL|nr:hypothetical protein [Paenibacillus pectinilyticus]OCT10741.1 hypothetical protein A8709_23180 [Paenibacillus pectinilyticus]